MLLGAELAWESWVMERDKSGDEEDSEVTVSHVFRNPLPEAEDADFRTKVWARGTAQGPGDLQVLHRTLLHALAHAAKMSEQVGVTLLPEREGPAPEHKSYREIYERSKRVAANLIAAGIQQGDRVLIVLPTSYEFIYAFFGVGLAGAVPVPTYPPQSLRRGATLDRLEQLAQHAEVAACITSKRISHFLGELLLKVKGLERVLLAEELLAPSTSVVKARLRRKDLAFIQYTSGSTGQPKGVLLTHENLLANIHVTGQAMRISRRDVVVSWLPLYHDMGLIGFFLGAVYWRLPLVLMSPMAFIAKPARWLKAIDQYRGTVSGAPNFAYQRCATRVRAEERQGLDLSSWRLAFNGAEVVHAQTVKDFQRCFAGNGLALNAMLPVYGLAEASLAVAFPTVSQPSRVVRLNRAALTEGRVEQSDEPGAISLVSVGRAMPAHEIALVDEAGRPVGEGRIGHLVVKGPSVMQGYHQNPRATAAALKHGWLWTGDLGFVLDGELFISGRAKDLIIVRGRNYYPDDLERIAERVAGLRAGGAVAFGVEDEVEGEQAILLCESEVADAGKRERLAAQLESQIQEEAELKSLKVVLVRPGVLPRTSSGKKERSRARSLYLAGALSRRGPVSFARVLAS